MLQSLVFFMLAGLAEIGGGYLIWLWLREGRAWWFGLIGALVAVLYGVIPDCSRPSSISVAFMPRMAGCSSCFPCSGVECLMVANRTHQVCGAQHSS